MKTARFYTLDELKCSEDCIVIRTQAGVEIYIFVENDKTFVLFPLGSELVSAEAHGRLTAGIVASPNSKIRQ